MQVGIFLIRYGAWLMPALALAACSSLLAALAIDRARRTRRALQRLASSVDGVRRGLDGVASGDRILVRGRIVVPGRGVDAFEPGAPCAIVSARAGDHEQCRRALALELDAATGRLPIVGGITLHAATEEHAILFASEELSAKLRDVGLAVDATESVTLRHVRAAEEVLVLGRVVSVLGATGTTYRVHSPMLGVGPDDDGRVHVVAMGTMRTRLLRVVPISALGAVTFLLVAPLVSMHAPPLAWTIPQPASELPHRLWLPLASPWRAHAIDAASEWLLAESAGATTAQRIELAAALREVAVDCAREQRLVTMLGWDVREGVRDECDTWIARSAIVRAPDADRAGDARRLTTLAIALDRGARLEPDALASPVHTLECPGCGALSSADPALDPWLVASVLLALELRSERMQRLRGEWLTDLAAWQALRGVRTPRLEQAIAHDLRDDTHVARARSSIDLATYARDGTGEVTATELDRALRDATESLPPGSPLRDRAQLFSLRLTHWAATPRSNAVTLVRLAAMLHAEGATHAAWDLAHLARRVAHRAEDERESQRAFRIALAAALHRRSPVSPPAPEAPLRGPTRAVDEAPGDALELVSPRSSALDHFGHRTRRPRAPAALTHRHRLDPLL